MNISNVTKKNNGKSRSRVPTSCEKARKAAAERKRKERERIKQDPEKYELMKQKEKERSRQRRESKKIKSINDLSERGKRKQRAEWRKRYHKHAERLRKQKVNDEITDLNTPPSSPNPVQNIFEPERDSRKESRKVNRKKKLRKSREKYKAKIKELEKQLKDQIKKTNRWKTRHHRLTKKNKSTKKCATNKKVCNAPKQMMNKRKSKTLLLKNKVKEFLTDDDNSYSTPGRKNTITKKKIKMQKRYLSDSLLILHKKFVSSTNIKISYALFCRLKPFWVLHRPTNKRDTCLCKYHENFWFLFQKCKQYRLIQHTNIRDLVSSVCCDLENTKCMYRECEECEPRTITFNENCCVPLQSMIHFFEWKNLKEEKMKKGKLVMVKVTRKVKEHCTLEELKNKLLTSLRPFMQHMYRVYHQSKFSKTLRTSLNDDEVFMVVDFSENYQFKYSTEIQSRHFGASNEQLVLHTGAYFLSKTVNDKKDISVSTFCTVSPNNRHDASAIWAHLQPIFVKIKNENNQVTRVHIMSDGPTKQYRNKYNLYLFCHFMQHFGFREASYNFSESGHGKSVADGVGGVVKRTADKAVLAGKDISTIDEFLCCVSMLKAEIIKIEDSSLAVTDQILNAALDTIIPVPNTMKIHQATWNLNEPLNLNCSYLSCEFCRTSSICSHIKTVTHTILKPKETSEESTEDDIAEEPTDDIMEEPGPSSHSNEKTNIEGSCSRLRYHDIYSDSESEDTPNDLVENDFVLIRLATKKSFKHYIGQVRKVYGDRDMDVVFLRKSVGGKFVCPPVEDIASVNYSDIVQVLQQPKVHRGLYIFEGVTDVPNLN